MGLDGAGWGWMVCRALADEALVRQRWRGRGKAEQTPPCRLRRSGQILVRLGLHFRFRAHR
jgi:hypothetical protein